MNANDVQAQFHVEAHDLVTKIEQELLHLLDDPNAQRIHTLMRAAHTLKGAAASVDKMAIQNVAHVLEDIFVALYNPNLLVDEQVEALLFEGLECLRLLIQGRQVDESAVMNRAASVIAQLQEKFGEAFKTDNPIPSSAELGFDIVAAMFEAGVTQRLETLKTAIADVSSDSSSAPALAQLTALLKTHANVFSGLAESLNLEGFGSIAALTLTALDRHPDQIVAIAKVALTDFSQARQVVLEGDRTQGGTPSAILQQYATRDLVDDKVSQRHNISSLETLDLTDIFEPNLSEPDIFEPTINNIHDSQRDEIEINETNEIEINETNEVEIDETNQMWGNAMPSSVGDDIGDESVKQLMADLAEWDDPSAPASSSPNGFQSSASPAPKSIYPQPIAADSPPLPPTQSQQTVTTSSSNNNGRPSTSIRVELEQLQRLEYLAGELLIKQNAHVNDQGQIQSLLQQILLYLRQHNQTIHELWEWSEDILISALTQRQVLVSSPLMSMGNGHENSQGSAWMSGNSNSNDKNALYLGAVTNDFDGTHSIAFPVDNHNLQDLDALEMDRHGHLHVLMQSALEESSRLESLITSVDQLQKRSQRSVKSQKRLLTQTWDTLTHSRMQSLGTLFQRLPRLLRQLSKTHSKQVNLVLPDKDILVDRLLVETVYDALIHLMRNAFDHGIESSEKRQSLGKSPVGTIWIRAFNQGRYTVIELEDDGAGIDLNQVGQMAIAQGLVTADQLLHCSPAQIMDFLFESGFSTVSQLSDLSGRGVGLDVVRSQIEQLKGSVSVTSEKGEGTCFTLRLPFNLSILQQMLCQADGIMYALPVEHIEQVILPQSNHVQKSMSGGLILKGHPVNRHHPINLYRLQDLLPYSASQSLLKTRSHYSASADSLIQHSLPDSPTSHIAKVSTSPEQQNSPVLLMRYRQTLVGIMVENILEEQELVIRPLETTIPSPPYIHGCSIFGDNQLALVIDPPTLMACAEHMTASSTISHQPGQLQALPAGSSQLTTYSALPDQRVVSNKEIPSLLIEKKAGIASVHDADARVVAPPSAVGLGRSRILVVEDSPTVRQTISTTLEEIGFGTLQAGDGLEALMILRQGIGHGQPAPTMILCDIEMPQMDGFQFLSVQNQDPSLASIPVVMVTSRSSHKHQQIALELGATGYLTKPCTRDDLLSMIRSVLA